MMLLNNFSLGYARRKHAEITAEIVFFRCLSNVFKNKVGLRTQKTNRAYTAKYAMKG